MENLEDKNLKNIWDTIERFKDERKRNKVLREKKCNKEREFGSREEFEVEGFIVFSQ